MRRFFTVLLVGCAHEVVAPAPAVPVPERAAEPQPQYTAYDWEHAAPPPLARRQPCPQCDDVRGALKGTQEALEVEENRRKELVKAHCNGIVTHTTRIFRSGGRVSGGPERAWLCNGKLVEVPETPEEQALAIRMGDLHRWVKDNCENESPVAVGEKLCVGP